MINHAHLAAMLEIVLRFETSHLSNFTHQIFTHFLKLGYATSTRYMCSTYLQLHDIIQVT